MKIWYSYMGVPYTGPCPPYYELAGKLWYDALVKNIPAIRQKVLELLEQKNIDLKTYFNTDIVEGGGWDARGFLSWGRVDKLLESEKGREVFAFFKDIPGIVLLSVSVLKPHTHVRAHNGDTDGTYRLHIPIYIPAGLPDCGLRVGGIDRPWTDDGITVFSDANMHEAWNQSDQTRIVLIADVVREEVINKKDTICVNVVALLLMHKIYATLSSKTPPKWLMWIMAHIGINILKILLYIYWPFRKKA
jgi:aspartyl/asparaginyl beta-hydroxylase (cupin superfamily)